MSEIVQTVEGIEAIKEVGEVKVVQMVSEVEKETAAERALEALVSAIEAEVVKPKTAADLIVEEIDKAAAVLYTAKKAGLDLGAKLKSELQLKKNQVNEELIKLGLAPIQDDRGFSAEDFAKVNVKEPVQNWTPTTDAIVVNEINPHSTFAMIVSFVTGLIGGMFTTWWLIHRTG